jgi:hypothetical protein
MVSQKLGSPAPVLGGGALERAARSPTDATVGLLHEKTQNARSRRRIAGPSGINVVVHETFVPHISRR